MIKKIKKNKQKLDFIDSLDIKGKKKFTKKQNKLKNEYDDFLAKTSKIM